MSKLRFSVIVLRSLMLAATAAGCAAPSEEEDGDVGDTTEEALSQGQGCRLARDAILSSTTEARKRAVARGFRWLDADVPYSQTASYAGYRTDCSGFVSMCWELGRSETTATFRNGVASHSLSSYDALLPGDALLRQGHIMLFLGWNDSSRSGACVLEQASTASDMQFRVRATSSLRSSGYKAIRADKLKSSGADEDATESVGEDPPVPETEGCWSATLKEIVPPMTCVQSLSNGIWYQCKASDKKWYRGVADGEGPFGPCASMHPL